MLFLQIPESSLQGYEMHKTLVLAKYQVLQGWASSFNAIGQFGTSQQ
jgi:hypothetical protein